MFDMEQRIELEPDASELRPSAEQWLDDAKLVLESQSDSSFLEPGDERFLEQMHNGMELSERRVAIIATLLERRKAFYIKTGEDCILEQYHALKMLTDRSAIAPGA